MSKSTKPNWRDALEIDDAGIEVSLLWRAVADGAKADVAAKLEETDIAGAIHAAMVAEMCIWRSAGEEDCASFKYTHPEFFRKDTSQ